MFQNFTTEICKVYKVSLLLAFALIFTSSFMLWSEACAQNSGPITLNNPNKVVNLEPYVSYSGNLIDINFSVTNRTEETQWALNLGSTLDGRTAKIRDANIFANGQRKELLLLDQFVDIQLLPGDTKQINLSMETVPWMPVTVSASLSSAEALMYNKGIPYYASSIFSSVVIGFAIGFFILIILKDDWTYLFHGIYCLLIAGLYSYSDHLLISEGFIDNNILAFIFLLLNGVSLLMTKFFLDLDAQHYSENYILRLLIGLSAFCALLQIFIPENFGHIKMACIFAPFILTTIILSALSFAQYQEGKHGSFLYGFGFASLAAGIVLQTLSFLNFGIIAQIPMSFFWVSTIAFTVFMFLAAKVKFDLIDQPSETSGTLTRQETVSLSRLRESREASDQARLLRVLESEREKLASLREKEAKRTEEMRIAKEAADQANKAKSAFLAVVTHEIRTPMNGVMGMTRLLLDGKLTKEQRDQAQTIKESGDSILSLINDILDFEKIERGKMDIENISFDLHRLVDSLIKLMSGHAEQKNIDLKLDIVAQTPRYVKGDPTRLRQILLNLISNAVKFTDKGSVTVTLKTIKDRDHKDHNYDIYFSVEDTGIGIPEKAQENLFNPFVQADSSISRRYGGTGLGLAITKGLIEAMGSAINILSREKEGSRFFFTLNMAAGEGETSQTSSENIEDESSQRILIVDDNQINRKVILAYLSKSNHELDLAVNSEEALEKIQTKPYDLIFMDIELPGMNGDEITHVIRQLPEGMNTKTPIIALTGHVMPEYIERFYASGMNGFLAKPINPKDLGVVIARTIQGDFDNPFPQEDRDPNDENKIDISLETQDISNLSLDDSEMGTDSFEDAIDNHKNISNELFDTDMLATLKNNLERQQLDEMFDGLWAKTDEIIEALKAAMHNKDAEELRARGHELKGMAGNFGLNKIANLSKQIEDQSKQGKIEGLEIYIQDLPGVTHESKTALNAWLNS